MAITQIRGAQVLDLTIDTADLAADSVTEAKLNTSVAGAGLAGGGGTPLSVNVTDGIAISGDDVILATSAAGDGLAYASGVLSVNVDGSTLEINADTLRVAALGITNNELALGAVDVDNLSDLRVTEGVAFASDVAAGPFTTKTGTTSTSLAFSVGPTSFTSVDLSFDEVFISGTVSINIV